jgi:hypothetical protein
MKNSGKRIFYSVVFVSLINLPLIVMAGHSAATR